MRMRRAVTLLMTVALLTGCASSTTVGSEELVDIEDEGNVERLGSIEEFEEPEPTPEPSPTPEPTAPAPAETAPTAAATEPAPSEPARPTYEPVTVAITADGFDPLHQRVWVGTEVRFENRDTVERRVTGLDDGYDSGPIPPGGVAVYATAEPGEFNFQDETRVYYVVRLEVLEP